MGVNRRMPDEEFMAWLEASCRASGVEVAVTDPEVLSRVASLMGGRAGTDRAQGAPAPSTDRARRAAS